MIRAIYSYRPLGLGQIRLLRINPGKWSEPITCSILHAPLEGKGSRHYEALSYAWGNQWPRAAVECGNGGAKVRVTQNCFSAIRRLRYADRERLVWIDAICIDQSKSIEKSQQVRQMGRIFQNATRVLIYLGEPTEDSETAIKCVVNPEGLTEQDERLALKNLLGRPWFNRVWVLQEVALSKAAVVLCGSMWVPWDCFVTQNVWEASMTTRSGVIKPAVLSYSSDSGLSRRSLLDQLHETRDNLSSDPRDKVIALIGMTPPDEHWSTIVDYNRSAEEIYTETAQRIITQTSSLRVLSGVQHRSLDNRSLPSWVPDWRVSTTFRPLALGGIHKQLYNAGGHQAIIKWSMPDNDASLTSLILRACGVKLGTITEVGHICNVKIARSYGAAIAQWKRQACKVAQVSIQNAVGNILQHFEVNSSDQSFFRILTATPSIALGTPPWSIETATQWYIDITRRRNYRKWFNTDASRFHGLVTQAVHGRRFITTDLGLMGLGPPLAESGDIVCVLLGAPVPFVLREYAQGKYFLIGECYMDGFMDGQALDRIADEVHNLVHIGWPEVRKLDQLSSSLEIFSLV